MVRARAVADARSTSLPWWRLRRRARTVSAPVHGLGQLPGLFAERTAGRPVEGPRATQVPAGDHHVSRYDGEEGEGESPIEQPERDQREHDVERRHRELGQGATHPVGDGIDVRADAGDDVAGAGPLDRGERQLERPFDDLLPQARRRRARRHGPPARRPTPTARPMPARRPPGRAPRGRCVRGDRPATASTMPPSTEEWRVRRRWRPPDTATARTRCAR